jgi:hypothetical protein
MKKQTISLTLITILLLAIGLPLVFANVPLSSRFDDEETMEWSQLALA